MEAVVSHALRVQQQEWTHSDDVTIIDLDSPIDVRRLLKP